MQRRVICSVGFLGVIGVALLATGATDNATSAPLGSEAGPAELTGVHTNHTPRLLAGLSSGLGDLKPLREVAGAQLPYIDGQLMVSAADGVDLATVAAAHGAAVVRPAGPSGYGVLEAPPGLDGADFQAALSADPGVRLLAKHGALVGAAKGGKVQSVETAADDSTVTDVALSSLQWHLESAVIPSPPPGLSEVVVAVLDSGVAAVPSLSGSAIVAPYDFVNGDADASDDHQHGTHIASVIASDGGGVVGVAPGVGLMPVKVLDENNQGYEIDLVDGLHWAVDNGADVINLSLSFGDGYVPSAPLVEAIQRAVDAGVVLVGAAGNVGRAEVTWPAASPHVIAVGALCADATVAPYSNLGGAMDIMAPGGCFEQDLNADGVPDGVVAESINLQDPSASGLWAMAGTSQAAAVVAGAAALAIADQGKPEQMALLMHMSTFNNMGEESFSQGTGAGALDADRLISEANYYNYYDGLTYDVAVMPYLVDNGDGTVTPTAQLTVMDTDWMAEAFGVTVLVSLHGSSSGSLSCEIARRQDGGECVISGAPVAADENSGALAWRFTVDAVVDSDEVAFRPGAMMFGGEELDAIAAAQNADPALREAMLALYWASGDEPELGALAESYAVVDSGSGLSTSPIALLFTPQSLSGVVGEDVSLAGTGLSTSPIAMRWMQLDGSGLSTSPIMLLAMTAFDGSGLSTSPIAMRSYSMLGSGLSTSPILMNSGTIDGGGLGELQALLDDGGWSSIDGAQAASALAGSGVLSVEAEIVGTGSSLGAAPVE